MSIEIIRGDITGLRVGAIVEHNPIVEESLP
jgi:hypothetical protein